MLFQRRKQLSREDATRVAEAMLPLLFAEPELHRILYDKTQEFSHYWHFTSNSVKYAASRNVMHCLSGGGPLLVDKLTAQVRVYPSGVDNIERDYELDIEAGDREWCLHLPCRDKDRLTVLGRLKASSGMSPTESAQTRLRLPGPLWIGQKPSLEWLCMKLQRQGLACKVKLCTREIADQLDWIYVSWPRGETSLEEVYSKRCETSYFRWHLKYKYYECPLPDIRRELAGNPIIWSPRFTNEQKKTLDDQLFDRAMLEHRRSLAMLILTSRNFDPNRLIPGLNNEPALVVAARRGDADMVAQLLTYGAKADVKDRNGLHVRQIAAELDHIEIEKMLGEREEYQRTRPQ